MAGVQVYDVIEVRGKRFGSVQECADHFGITRATVYIALSKGRMDRVGLGRWETDRRKPQRPFDNVGGMARAKPVKIGQVEFRSRREASRLLGMSERYVSKVLDQGSPRSKQRLLARVMKYEAEQMKQRKEGNLTNPIGRPKI